MKSTVLSAATLLAMTSSGLAQYTQQSQRFSLSLSTANKTLDGQYLTACHEGAGIEALCVIDQPEDVAYYTYHLNTSSTSGATGYLTWKLETESEPLTLYYEPSTNVVLPLFEPTSDAQIVGFDETGHLYIPSSLDDTVTPPTDDKSRDLYRWFVCETNYEGYVYQTLAWVMGTSKPENPTCQSVDVLRVFN